MERDVKTYVSDIRENCDLILEFVKGLDLARYKKDALVKSAVERRFIIIGEAFEQIEAVGPDNPWLGPGRCTNSCVP